MADDEVQQGAEVASDGFDGYVETTVDPGPWFLVATTVFCFGVMLIVVPGLVWWKLRKRKSNSSEAAELFDDSAKTPVATGPCQVLSFDKEMRSILKLAVPYTVTALTSSSFSNVCLILVSQNVGTKPVAAYALVQVLVGLTDGALQGPIYGMSKL